MNKALKKIVVAALFIGILFMSGCWDQKIFEETGFILQIGLELNEKNELVYSLTMPVIAEEIEQDIEILSVEAPLLREARDKIRSFSGKRIEGGKTQQIIFSMELAREGVGDLLDVFLRSAENPMLANIIVLDGSPLEMFEMSLEYKDKTRVAFYIIQLIKEARIRTATPEIRIFDFEVLRRSQTMDPIASFLRYDKEKIEIIGTALFNDDKMVGELDAVDSGILTSLMGDKINFSYYYRNEDTHSQSAGKSGIAFLFKLVKRKIEIDTSNQIPKISFKLDIQGTLDEYDSKHKLDEASTIEELEVEVGKALKKECEEVLGYLQRIGSDPIGFAEILRSKHNEYFKTLKWDKVYPEIEIKVDVKVNIEFHGAIN